MKKILFFLTMSLSFFVLNAQKYETIKNQLVFNKYKEAKVELDKAMSNPKFTSNAEAYILKTTIYAGLSMEEGTKGTPTGDQLAMDADAAFKKYKEMDPAMSLINDPIYQNGPINLYSNYYSSGYADYSEKKWDASYAKFKRAVEYSDLLINKKLLQFPVDTTILILAGITAENSSSKDEAVMYYGRLADNKITGEGFESVYRYLVSHYFAKKDMASFEKYKALGKQLYPKSEYFDYDKVDFAAGLAESFTDKIKALDEVLATDPNNYKANELLWSIIYDSINLNKERDVQPKNFELLEARMLGAMNKNITSKPDEIDNYVFMGNYYVGKKDAVGDARQAHADDVKARTKPGTMASKEDVAKREKLDKDYSDAMEAIREPYENAARLFALKTGLDAKEKSQYKNIAGYLSEIYEMKKKLAKGKPADLAKYTAEEKKWNDVYESIK
ncbi:MAG: hypothetical protein WBA96_13265 [Chitinophagaceae bacterium]|jgi:hypothetical protein